MGRSLSSALLVGNIRDPEFRPLDSPRNLLQPEEAAMAMNENLVIVSREQILRRICSEYLEMPGLRLSRPQAQRLWGLDEQTCAQLLESLTEEKFLYKRPDGMYARLTDGAVTFPQLQMVKAERDPRFARSATFPTGGRVKASA
jgi:hypothetical protein